MSSLSTPVDSSDSRTYADVREMGWYEKLHLLGQTYPITTLRDHPYAITFIKRGADLPSADTLQARINVIERKWPAMRSVVVDADTAHPKLAIPVDKSQARVREATVDLSDISTVMTDELNRFSSSLHDQGAHQWEVSRLTDNDGQVNIAVSASHVLMDATGMLRLVEALFSDTKLAYEPGLPPNSEDLEGTNCRTRWPVVAQEAIKEYIVEPLLAKLHKSASEALTSPPWPGSRVSHPADKPNVSVVCETMLTDGSLKELKTMLKKPGVETLHPFLHTAFVSAVYNATGQPSEPFACLVPKRERVEDTHTATGIAISAPTVNMRPCPDASLIAETLDVQRSLADPAVRLDGQGTIGLTQWIPTEPSSAGKDRGHPSGWTERYETALNRPAPFMYSMSMSNLGATRMKDVHWSQTASMFETPLTASILGHENGLELSIAFREGSVVMREQVEEMARRFEATMESTVGKTYDEIEAMRFGEGLAGV